MYLEKLQLINFKNYDEVRLEFSPRINVLVGKNGSGKTNLLDAVHYLSLTRSAFCADPFSVRHGGAFFSIKGSFRNGPHGHDILCSYQAGGKKMVKEGLNEYNKLSEHIGKYPVVLIAPDDTELVKEGSDERRKFFDSLLSQLDTVYLNNLIQYNQALRQRNSLLKLFAEKNSYDEIALESYDSILARTGDVVFQRRSEFVKEFIPVFKRFYNFIVAEEDADVDYRTGLAKSGFEEGLRANRKRDLLLQRTNFGIHRDDYVFTLGGGDLKRLGSQGQQKSFIIALKLAQFEIIKSHKQFKPILLLDDIFDKLDDFRIAKLLQLIHEESLGQLFITDARPDRTATLLKQINIPATIFAVDSGRVTHE